MMSQVDASPSSGSALRRYAARILGPFVDRRVAAAIADSRDAMNAEWQQRIDEVRSRIEAIDGERRAVGAELDRVSTDLIALRERTAWLESIVARGDVTTSTGES